MSVEVPQADGSTVNFAVDEHPHRPDGQRPVNVYGSGISLGNPVAATGARMVTSAIYELRRRGGMGAAMVIEVA